MPYCLVDVEADRIDVPNDALSAIGPSVGRVQRDMWVHGAHIMLEHECLELRKIDGCNAGVIVCLEQVFEDEFEVVQRDAGAWAGRDKVLKSDVQSTPRLSGLRCVVSFMRSSENA